MAEGGEENNDNPFSFKRFVKKKDNLSDEDSDGETNRSETDIFDLPDLSAPHKKEKQRLEIAEDEPAKKKEENPFSFKKFLKGGAKAKSKSKSGAPDVASDLPDFVQDQFSGDSSPQVRVRPTNFSTSSRGASDVPLPDFALDSSSGINAPSPLQEVENLPASSLACDLPSPGAPVVSPRQNGHSFNAVFSGYEPQGSGRHSSGGLPDFLSDSALNSVNNPLDDAYDDDVATIQVNGDLELEIRRLRAENAELRRQLDESRRFSERESRRVGDVLKEMEAIQKKEAEDTAALENMVQQVEANLVTTTQRAVAAENTIKKQKQEIKTLQNQVSLLRKEKQPYQPGQSGPDPASREKVRQASEQLAAAATNAEQTLKQLLGGVDQIKMVSEFLASIDKVTDVEGATGGSPT